MRSRLVNNLFGASSGLNAVIEPYSHANGLPPVLAFHGLNLDPSSLLIKGVIEILAGLANQGHIEGMPFSASGWGNSASLSLTDQGDTWLQSNGAANVRRGLFGLSHGGCMATKWAAANLSKTAWMVLGIPALDLQYLRTQDVVEGIAFRASIDAAAGVTYPAALPANFSPMDIADDLSSIPCLMFTASDDDISHNAATTWATAHGNTTHIDLGALGHSQAALDAISTYSSTIINFANTHRVG